VVSENPKTLGVKVAEIQEFRRQIFDEQGEMDADPTPRTLALALRGEGRLEEAEAAARQTISDFEKENAAFGNNLPVVKSKNLVLRSSGAVLHEQNTTAVMNGQLSLLAEALIAHGITLARLKKFDAAQASLERAIAVAQEADAHDKVALAALTMIEEVEQLSRETLLSAYELASANMAQMKNRRLQWRVIRAAKKVMVSLWGEMDSAVALEILLAKPRSLTEQVVSYEGKLIRQALMQTNGSMADASSLLTLTPESLARILEQRHKDLLAAWARRHGQTERAACQHSPVNLHERQGLSVSVTKTSLLTAIPSRR